MEPKNRIEDVRQYVKENSQGYEVLSDVLYRLVDRIDIKCPNGHVYDVVYRNFRDGRRCPYCYGNKRLTLEQVTDRVKDLAPDYTLLSTEYKNRYGKLMFQCPNDHQFEKSLDAFECRGQRCPQCNKAAKAANNDLEESKKRKKEVKAARNKRYRDKKKSSSDYCNRCTDSSNNLGNQ